MLRRIWISAAILSVCAIASQSAEIKRIEGYQNYKFGMTLDQAKRVNADAAETKCKFTGVVICLEYSATVGAFPADVTVQFAGDRALLTQVILTFRALDEPIRFPCDAVAKELLTLLVTKYGERPFAQPHNITWTFPNGGSVTLSTLCVGSENKSGINVISYRPSAPL